jgi:hypothetical protein
VVQTAREMLAVQIVSIIVLKIVLNYIKSSNYIKLIML